MLHWLTDCDCACLSLRRVLICRAESTGLSPVPYMRSQCTIFSACHMRSSGTYVCRNTPSMHSYVRPLRLGELSCPIPINCFWVFFHFPILVVAIFALPIEWSYSPPTSFLSPIDPCWPPPHFNQLSHTLPSPPPHHSKAPMTCWPLTLAQLHVFSIAIIRLGMDGSYTKKKRKTLRF